MTRLLRILLVAVTLALAGCVGTQVSTQIGTITSGPSITAVNLAFDRSELVITAGQATGLLFDNRDSAPHNVAIYADEGRSQAVFVGEVFSGPGSRQYELPALSAGTYFFRCDIHQDMKGTLVAKP
jgi:plastocyanin